MHIFPCAPSASEACCATATTVCHSRRSANQHPSMQPSATDPFAKSLLDLTLGLFLGPEHSVEAEIMTQIALLHYRKEKQLPSCCSVSKGKNSQRYYPFATSRWREFCARFVAGGRYKKSLLLLNGTAGVHCLNYQSYMDATLSF